MRMTDVIDVVILLLIGLVFHLILPGVPLVGGMKPDYSLAVLFLIIATKEDKRLVQISILVVGLITAFTSSFPFLVNFLEKILTGVATYYIVHYTRERFNSSLLLLIFVTFFGTLLSGSIFAILAANLSNMTVTFTLLLKKIILPTALLNVVACYILYVTMEYGDRICQSFTQST